MFGIVSASDFKAKASRDNAALQADIANPDLAINAVLSAYHLHEWVWRLVLKPAKPAVLRGKVLRTCDDWKNWLDQNCPHFELIQDLANGSKHCLPVAAAVKIDGYAEGPYGIGPYGMPYLLVDLGEDLDPEQRWIVASDALNEIDAFWAEVSAELKF